MGLSADTKEKFQAVSLAYEIINRPEWRSLYDEKGWDAPLVDFPLKNRGITEQDNLQNQATDSERSRAPRHERSRAEEPRSRSTTPILRPAVNQDARRSRSAGRGIRWSEQVEELVFRQDPEEIESRKLRSPLPEPEPSFFDDDWMREGFEHKGPGSFMANFLSEIDQSLDGLEASLDGLMGRGFEDWSLSSKGSKASSTNNPSGKRVDEVDRGSTCSPVSVESEGSSYSGGTATDDSDTVPSKLTQQGQGPTGQVERNAPSPEGWDAGGSMTSTLPSTIHSLDESEDLTVKQLFTVLTKTTDERRKREDPPHENQKAESTDDRSSPSDVRKMPTEEDEVARAFSDYGNKYVDVQPRAQKSDYFDPFNDSASTININDSDFGGPLPGFREVPKKLTPPSLPVVEDVSSATSTPERSQTVRNRPRNMPKMKPTSAQADHIFSKTVPEFHDVPEDGPLQTRIIDTTSFPRAQSEFSSLTGGTRSTAFDNSVKTEHVMNPANGHNFCAPVQSKPLVEDNQSVVSRQTREEHPGTTHAPCDTDFLSHLFCYTNALSNDLTSFSNEFSSKLSATQAMILESLTFSDEQMRSVASAMEMPGVERSNTI